MFKKMIKYLTMNLILCLVIFLYISLMFKSSKNAYCCSFSLAISIWYELIVYFEGQRLLKTLYKLSVIAFPDFPNKLTNHIN